MTSCKLIPAKDVKAQNLVFGRFQLKASLFLGNPYETLATDCVMIKNNVSLEKSCSKISAKRKNLQLHYNQNRNQTPEFLGGNKRTKVEICSS